MIRWCKDTFIPHAGNDFRPNLLERISVGVMLILILLSFAIANMHAILWMGSEWLVSTILPAVIVELTNEERTVDTLPALTRDPVLDRAATLKAEDMARHGYFSHYSPAGVSPWYWFDSAGYDYLHAGENLAVHFTESFEVVDAWMDSPSHRANIMSGLYTDIGVGTAEGEYQGFPTVYVVQLFGTRRAPVPGRERGGAEVAGLATSGSEADTLSPSDRTLTIEKVALSEATSPVLPATVETVAVGQTAPSSTEEVPVRESLNPPKTAVPAMVNGLPLETEPVDEPNIVTVESTFASSSREGVPASIMPDTEVLPPTAVSMVGRAALAPSAWLELIYLVLAGAVLIALTASLSIEWRAHHPVQVLYAGGLLTLMALLLYIHTTLTGVVTIV